MILSGEIHHSKRLVKRLDKLPDFMQAILIQRVKLAAVEIHGNAVRGLAKRSQHRKVKRYYGKGKRPKVVWVSKPGDTPNTDTSTLINSVMMDLQFTGNDFSVMIGTNLDYGLWLEFGSSKFDVPYEARPWLAPAFKKFAKSGIGKFFRIELPKVA